MSKIEKFIFHCIFCTVFVLDPLDAKIWKFPKLERQASVMRAAPEREETDN